MLSRYLKSTCPLCPPKTSQTQSRASRPWATRRYCAWLNCDCSYRRQRAHQFLLIGPRRSSRNSSVRKDGAMRNSLSLSFAIPNIYGSATQSTGRWRCTFGWHWCGRILTGFLLLRGAGELHLPAETAGAHGLRATRRVLIACSSRSSKGKRSALRYTSRSGSSSVDAGFQSNRATTCHRGQGHESDK